MTLSGQWIAPYTGSNKGTLVVELDDMGEHYAGVAVVWDDVPDHLNAIVRFHTTTKANEHKIEKVPVQIIYNNGDFVSGEVLQRLHSEKQIVYPATVNIELSLKRNVLQISWTSSTGGFGKSSAEMPKTRSGMKSDLRVRRLNTWAGFKAAVNKLPPKQYIFRGQEDSQWRLRSGFYRSGRSNMERYLNHDIADLQKYLSAVTNHMFNLNDPIHYGAFLNLAQHHGYPTPLLDWTWSPYVAAFFAFRALSRTGANKGKVRIFKFDIAAWNAVPRAPKLFAVPPNVSILDAVAFGNPRSIPQQAISTISNVDDIESHIRLVEGIRKKTYLEAFDLPAAERANVMNELAIMGITAGSLFPGLDGACEALKERNF